MDAKLSPIARAARRAQLGRRLAAAAFWTALAGMVLATAILAAVNRAPGSPDSMNNLDTARNLAAGRGFTSNLIQQLYVPQSLPAPETIRPPGIPFVLAGLFRLVGVSLAVPVLLNGVTVLATALVLRSAIRTAGGGWLADLAGVLVVVSTAYEMVSIWNNNAMVLCTAALLWIAARRFYRDWATWKTVVACAAVSAAGFFFKPTFVLTAVPASVALLLLTRPKSAPPLRTMLEVGGLLVLLAGLTSPYWGWNLAHFGKPLASPWKEARLAIRYGGMEHGKWTTVRFDRPVTYEEVRSLHGQSGLIGRDLELAVEAVYQTLRQNPALYLLLLLVPLVFPARWNWRDYAVPLLALAEPVFSSVFYWHVETRYLWPIFPVALYALALAARDYQFRPLPRPAALPRPALAAVLIGLTLMLAGGRAQILWSRFARQAQRPTPAWAAQTAQLGPDAVVLTDDPFAVAWYSGCKAVILPGGDRADLLRVVAQYRPTHCLITDPDDAQEHGLALVPRDIRLLASAPATARDDAWSLYEARLPVALAAEMPGTVR